MRRNYQIFLGVVVLLIGGGAIRGEEKSSFRFPGGNGERGSEVFVALNCVQCHSVAGVHFEVPADRRFDLKLAGEVRFVKNYVDIVKAISNPKHVISKRYANMFTRTELEGLSPLMEDFTNRMTLGQFMDLVAFLDKAYSNSVETYDEK